MKKTLLALTLCSAIVALPGCAQKAAQKGSQKAGRYHKNLLYEAGLYFDMGDYYYASELYSELMEVYPESPEVNGRLGISYWHLPPLKEKARAALERAVILDDTEALFFLAKQRHEEYRFFDALELLAIYEHRPERRQPADYIAIAKASASRAADFVKTPLQVKIVNLGAGVNSNVHDYAPVWDMQGNRIFFTSRRRLDSKSEKDFTEQFDENIYVVDLGRELHVATAAEGEINSRNNDAAVACSRDGQQLIVYRTSKDGLSGNLFMSFAEGNSWGKLEKLSEKINSKNQEPSACFGGPEENVLYFSSDRPGGYGGKDLYKVQHLPDGNWSDPVNLGPRINTPLDEDAPFVAADGTLYFASKGHQNMGGYDIFYAHPLGDGFSVPSNMGFPVNTPADDIFFSIDSEGKVGYFSSDRKGGYGLQDLYRIHFDELGSVIFRGELISQNENIQGRATIKLIDQTHGNESLILQTEPGKNDFVMALESGRAYTMVIEAKGFATHRHEVNLSAESVNTTVVSQKIMLSK